MIKPWTLQPKLAKRRAKNNMMTTFTRTFMAAMGGGALLGHELSFLLLDHCLVCPRVSGRMVPRPRCPTSWEKFNLPSSDSTVIWIVIFIAGLHLLPASSLC